MSIDVTQRNSTRNQSTADYEQKKVFLFDNRFSKGVLENDSDPGVDVVLKSGMLVFRSSNGNLTLQPVYTSLVGVLAIDGEVTLAPNQDIQIDFCNSGTLEASSLIIPSNLPLFEIVSGLQIADHLRRIGFHLEAATEQTKFDN